MRKAKDGVKQKKNLYVKMNTTKSLSRDNYIAPNHIRKTVTVGPNYD